MNTDQDQRDFENTDSDLRFQKKTLFESPFTNELQIHIKKIYDQNSFSYIEVKIS